MLRRKIIFAFCLICLVSSDSRSQLPPRAKPASDASRASQPVPPPPKPAGDGPSLEVTMKFIQDKMSDIGTLRYSVGTQDVGINRDSTPTSYIEGLNNVVADPQRCTISYHSRLTTDLDSKPSDLDRILNLKEVKKITVRSEEQYLNDFTAGKIIWTFRPSIFTVTLLQRDKQGADFHTDDEELANRLARAINHAVELCTPDKKPEPF